MNAARNYDFSVLKYTNFERMSQDTHQNDMNENIAITFRAFL